MADMQVHKAHLIGHNVKDALMTSSLGIADVLVHIEPAGSIFIKLSDYFCCLQER